MNAAADPSSRQEPAPPIPDAAPPRLAEVHAEFALEMLLALEADVRMCPEETELVFLIANETRKLIGARQTFVLRRVGKAAFHVRAISSLPAVDRNAPLVRWIEEKAERLAALVNSTSFVAFARATSKRSRDDRIRDFPFDHLMAQPLKLRSGALFARADCCARDALARARPDHPAARLRRL